MSTCVESKTRVSRGSPVGVWIGRGLSGLAILVLLFDFVAKVARVGLELLATAQLDMPPWVISWLGGILIAATVPDPLPNTTLLGAIVRTGFLGGTV